MKHALVLASDLSKKDWICYAIAADKAALRDLNCYNPATLKLPKSQYPGDVDNLPLKKPSCSTGNVSEFRIVSFSNPNLKETFNLATV